VVALGILLFGAFVFGPYIYAAIRTGRLRRELEELRAERSDTNQLTARVWQLEKAIEELKLDRVQPLHIEPPLVAERPAPVTAEVPAPETIPERMPEPVVLPSFEQTFEPAAEAPPLEPVPERTAEPFVPIYEQILEPAVQSAIESAAGESIIETVPEHVMAAAAVAETALPKPATEPAPEPPPEALPQPSPIFATATAPAWRNRLSSSMEGQEWESTLGGNWLNKLGVLVLIIGIALFLGYSFTRMGPLGRVATALAVSAGMLAGGVSLERRAQYRVFARGLIGGGWAGIYFTSYAMYAVDAAKVILSPWIASILLLAVAAGMIAHSLRYRSQAVSGLAYFVAFATLALTPVTTFSVIALLPLAASLLYLAHRFEWFKMALFGVIATYATCASRGDSGASIAAAQGIVGAYWLLFEIFVILRSSRRKPFELAEQLIFPLNTLGLFALSLPKWHSTLPHNVWMFLAACATVYVIGAILRGQRPEPRLFDRILNAGYEGPITLAAVFAAIAIWLRLTTVWIDFGLLLEGEILFLAGLWLGQVYLQRLGAAVFGVATAKLVANDALHGERIGRAYEWTPVALFSAALMYINRYLSPGARYFSYGAAVPLLLVAGFESPASFVAVAWFALAVVLFEFGSYKNLIEFRFQSYGFAAFAMGALLVNNLEQRKEWLPVGLCVLLAYWLTMRARKLSGVEAGGIPLSLSVCAAISAAIFTAFIVPPRFLGTTWIALAAVMFELGIRNLPRYFRWQSYPIAALGWIVMMAPLIDNLHDPAHRIPLGLGVLLTYWLTLRTRTLTDREGEIVPLVFSLCTTTSAAMFVAAAAPSRLLGAAWIALAAILLELGLRGLPKFFRDQSYPVALLGWGHVLIFGVFSANKDMPLEWRLSLGASALLSYAIAARVFSTDRLYRIAGSWAGTIFASTLLWVVLADPVVAVGWAILSLILMEAGNLHPALGVLTLQADLLAAAVFGRLFMANFVNMGSTAGISHRLLTTVPIVAAEYYAWRRRQGTLISRVYFYAAAILVVALMRFELGRVLTVTGWAAFALALFWLGMTRRDIDFRLQAYAIALLCFWRSWTTNFYVPDSFAGVPGRIATAAFVIAAFYLAQLLAPRESSPGDAWPDRHSRTLFSVLASALVSILIYYEVGGGVLTVAWGVQATCLLAAGFWIRDRILRLSGLLVFLVCILKLFLYDLRNLDTMNRILSFIVLGAVMVGVSWVYTRFRNQIQRYL
jgi:uncharacterized membrane protein